MIEIRLGDVDASAGTCSSWTVESGVKRLADNCLSSVSKYKKRLGREFWQPASCIQPIFSVLELLVPKPYPQPPGLFQSRTETPNLPYYFF